VGGRVPQEQTFLIEQRGQLMTLCEQARRQDLFIAEKFSKFYIFCFKAKVKLTLLLVDSKWTGSILTIPP